MSATLVFKDQKDHNAVLAEVLYKGKLGAAQLRAVVPLAKLKRVLSAPLVAAIQERTGKPMTFDQIAGHPQLGPALDRRTAVMGRHAALNLLQRAAASPAGTLAKKAGALSARKKRILQFVAIAVGGGLVAYGGWRGLEALLAKRRTANAAKLRAGGANDSAVARAEEAAAKQDRADLDAAAQLAEEQTEDQEDDRDEGEEGNGDDRDDASGFSFRKVFRSVTQPHTLVTDRFARRRGGPARRGRPAPPPSRAEEEAPPEEEDATPEDAAAGLSFSNPLARKLALHAATSVVPGGGATMAVAKAAHKKNPALSKSAVRLAKARSGDPKAKKEIKVVRAAASQGHPGAQKELARLHQANALAAKVEKRRSLFEHGIAGRDDSLYGAGCS